MRIEIDNITQEQAFAISDMLALMQDLGKSGASRWIAFYADGDGNFKPQVTVDGESPLRCAIGTFNRWHPAYFKDEGGEYSPEVMYFIDPDTMKPNQEKNNESD
jgi:hypothetical protein